MTRVRVESFSISIDGFGAGAGQSRENPLGIGGKALHRWAFTTHTFRKMFGQDGGDTGLDDQFASRGFNNIGAWILGRNMFGPVRGPWLDESWKGWWGDTPPYHCPVFVLTHHPRKPLELGGTVFHFVTDGFDSVIEQAKTSAQGRDVRIGGGVATIQQGLRKGVIDELHIAISPVLLGTGESLFSGLDMVSLGYECIEQIGTAHATHVVIRKKA